MVHRGRFHKHFYASMLNFRALCPTFEKLITGAKVWCKGVRRKKTSRNRPLSSIYFFQFQSHSLTEENVVSIGAKAEGYSGADMATLCKEAAMGPIRSLDYSRIDEVVIFQVLTYRRDPFTEGI